MRAAVLLGFLAACGREGFDPTGRSIDAGSASSAVDATNPTIDASPPGWLAFHPVAYYPFDGNGADLAYAAGTVACTGCTFQPGHRGSAVLAPSQTLPDHLTASADFTAALWIYVPSTFPGNYAGCGTFSSSQTDLEADDQPAYVMLYSRTNNLQPTSVGTAVTGDTWLHVAMTYAASTKIETIYVDATAKGSANVISSDSLQGSLIGGGTCTVMVDELFVFDRVLTTSELAMVRDL